MPTCDSGFFDWLIQMDCSKLKIYALQEGTVSASINNYEKKDSFLFYL
jgi:hypothetical protein